VAEFAFGVFNVLDHSPRKQEKKQKNSKALVNSKLASALSHQS